MNARITRLIVVVLSALILAIAAYSGAVAKVWALLPESGHSKQQRADAEWYRYRAEQQCKITNTRTRTDSHRTYLISHSNTITEYEWTCRGGDVHWTR